MNRLFFSGRIQLYGPTFPIIDLTPSIRFRADKFKHLRWFQINWLCFGVILQSKLGADDSKKRINISREMQNDYAKKHGIKKEEIWT